MGQLSGVYKTTKKNGETYYRSSITYRGKHISLGSFQTETLAHKAYREADCLLQQGSLMPEHYENHPHVLSFAKWVVLTNFCNNGVYIKTPIYLKERYFLYYFTPRDFFLFDADDLFYYSTHTISRRGGHLFVNDYGMQVNILSRYGIKNYAVPGKDYMFVNGDTHDFRYSNIRIINHYHGVEETEVNGKPCYLTKIHIVGDTIVGRYQTEAEAAIAYNKAASILWEKGCTRQFPLNYIIDMDSEQYHALFESIKISDSILSRREIKEETK